MGIVCEFIVTNVFVNPVLYLKVSQIILHSSKFYVWSMVLFQSFKKYPSIAISEDKISLHRTE